MWSACRAFVVEEFLSGVCFLFRKLRSKNFPATRVFFGGVHCLNRVGIGHTAHNAIAGENSGRGSQEKPLFLTPEPGVASVGVDRHEPGRRLRRGRQWRNIRKGRKCRTHLTRGCDECEPMAHFSGCPVLHIYS